ncbi:hypothetical protein OROGR_029644 [Orobanche gracilis]
MPRTGDVSPSSSSLIAFKPRQVLLLEQQQLAVSALMAKAILENPAQLKPEDESLLLFSVALWLENKGFSKVLKRFLSAAQIQDDTWKAKALNLNEVFSKYQEIRYIFSVVPTAYNVDSLFTKRYKSNHAREQLKSQKKQEEQVDITKETNRDANCTASEKIESKKKKQSKGDIRVAEADKTSSVTTIDEKMSEPDVHDQGDQSYKIPDDLSHKDHKFKASKESNCEEVTVDQSTKKQKDKKKKSKSISQSLDSDENQIDIIPEATKSENQGLLSKKYAAEELDTEITHKKSKKKSVEAAEDVVNESKKASKKRKRMAPDENENPSGEGGAVEESKSKKSKGLEEGKDVPQVAHPGANGHASQKIKEENLIRSQVGSHDLSTEQSDGSTKITINENRVDTSGQQKSARKQRNHSAEPKIVNAFQRVKVDEVEFVDERLQDNSYWAKDGAETGYGAKAQEVLGQVKGRDFRHEKTKKKRGSSRGGQIDLQSHSIKFNFPDE